MGPQTSKLRTLVLLLATCLGAGGCDQEGQPGLGGSAELDGALHAPSTRKAFLRAGGRAIFVCGAGDPEDFLYRGELAPDGTRRGDQETLIAKLGVSGANGLYFQAIRSHGGDGEPDHNPFRGNDPERGLNDAVLAQWNGWLGAMNQAGIVPYFFIYDDGARPWRTGDAVHEEEASFVRDLVSGFAHHELLVWVIAEEYSEALTRRSALELARRIRQADPVHPIAIHQLAGFGFDFAEAREIDQFAVQTALTDPVRLHRETVAAFERAAGRYGLVLAEIAGHGRGDDARRRNWAVATGGAYLLIYDIDIARDARELADCGRLVRFFESTGFDRMSPADQLSAGDTDYVLAEPGRSYIAYAHDASDALGLKSLPGGSLELYWFDPRTGMHRRERRVVTPGDQRFPLPSGFRGEVALYVEVRSE